ncbi:hypothetical protein DOY81_010509, partial [Sarcophaga bullata]
ASQQNNDEVHEVLNKYLELFQQNSIAFKYYLAPNSVIDWYGRTVRGANKIHDYLRHEIYNNFDHIEFTEPNKCGPIETKTSHMRTKIISTKPIDHVHPINRVPDMVRLKSYADSDVEDNELPETSAFANAIIKLTPPSSAKKVEENEEVREIEKDEYGDKSHRSLKRTHSGRFSYLKRLPTHRLLASVLVKITRSRARYIIVIRLCHNKEVLFGVIVLEIATRLRISYRRKLEGNQVQFAL